MAQARTKKATPQAKKTVRRTAPKADRKSATAKHVPAAPIHSAAVQVARPSGIRAIMLHPLAGQSSFALRSWIALLGVASFALAMGSGLMQTANMVGQEVGTAAPIVHREGRVAGATVNMEPGIVTIVVQPSADNQTTYQLTTLGPLSVFNLMRVAGATTALKAEVIAGPGGAAITNVNGTPSTAKASWRVRINDAPPASFDEPVILPGSTVTLTLAP